MTREMTVFTGRCALGRERAGSSPPAANRTSVSRAAAAARAAEAATTASIAAAEAAREAEWAAAFAAGGEASTEAAQWPPVASQNGNRFWLARDFPDLEDGVYTAAALLSRGVDPDRPAASGLLQGWKTAEPALRRALSWGRESSLIFWR